jgi:hypothetical protein
MYMTLPLSRSIRLIPLVIAAVVGATVCVPGLAQARSLDDANFTGPLITPNPAGIAQGHLYVEPYLIRVDSRSSYDGAGNRHRSAQDSSAWLTVLPIVYGLGERVTVQANLSAVRAESGGARSSGFRAGDTTARLQYLLQAPSADGTRPAISLALSQRYATGSHDRIGGNPLNAQGDGVQRTSLALGIQQVVWMPNDRPLRWRGQLSASPAPARVAVHGHSVYDTPAGFRGSVARGSALSGSLGAEYSINPRWVAVMEVAASRETRRRLIGYAPGTQGVVQHIDEVRPASTIVTLAPAIEYHFTPTIGLIAGVEFSVAGRNSGHFISPQVALGMYF